MSKSWPASTSNDGRGRGLIDGRQSADPVVAVRKRVLLTIGHRHQARIRWVSERAPVLRRHPAFFIRDGNVDTGGIAVLGERPVGVGDPRHAIERVEGKGRPAVGGAREWIAVISLASFRVVLDGRLHADQVGRPDRPAEAVQGDRRL